MPGLMDILARLGSQNPGRPRIATPTFAGGPSIYDRLGIQDEPINSPMPGLRTPPFAPRSQPQIAMAPALNQMPQQDAPPEQPSLVPPPSPAQEDVPPPSSGPRMPLTPTGEVDPGMNPGPAPAPTAMTRMAPPQVNLNFPTAPSDVPESTLRDLNTDYQRQRSTLESMPRKNDPRLKTGVGRQMAELLGGYGANLAAASPLWYARAGAPQLAQLSKKIGQNTPYNRAMQDWQEEQAVGQGLGTTSTGMAKTQDTLATGQTNRDLHRAQTEMVKLKPSMEANKGMMDLNDEQARMLRFDEDAIANSHVNGVPLRAPARLVSKLEETGSKERIATERTQTWEKVKTNVTKSQEEIAKGHDETRRYTAELNAAAADARQAQKDLAAMERVKERNKNSQSLQAQRTSNTDKLIRAQQNAETAKVKALETNEQTYNRAVSSAKDYLKDPATGQVLPLEVWQQRAESGDGTAAARVGSYTKIVSELEKQRQTQADTVMKSYNAVMNLMPRGNTPAGQSAPGQTVVGKPLQPQAQPSPEQFIKK